MQEQLFSPTLPEDRNSWPPPVDRWARQTHDTELLSKLQVRRGARSLREWDERERWVSEEVKLGDGWAGWYKGLTCGPFFLQGFSEKWKELQLRNGTEMAWRTGRDAEARLRNVGVLKWNERMMEEWKGWRRKWRMLWRCVKGWQREGIFMEWIAWQRLRRIFGVEGTVKTWKFFCFIILFIYSFLVWNVQQK